MRWIVDIFKRKRIVSPEKANENVVRKSIANPPYIGNSAPFAYQIPLKYRNDFVNAVMSVPQLSSVVRILSDYFSRGKFKLYKVQKNGKKIEIYEHEILQKLRRPNPIQSGIELRKQLYAYEQIDGNSYLYAGVPSNILKTQGVRYSNLQSLWALPSQYMSVVPNSINIYAATELNEIIKYYRLQHNGYIDFDARAIMHINQLTIDYKNTYNITGDSPIRPLHMPLSNIVAGYKAHGVALTESKPVVAATPNPQNQDSLNPLSIDDINEINERFKQYGNQPDMHRLMWLTQSMNFEKIGYTPQEMQLSDVVKENLWTICNQVGCPSLYGLIKEGDSKYNNLEQLKKGVLNEKIIPDADLYTEELNIFFQLAEEGYLLTYSFDHLPEMQKDKKILAEVNRINTESISKVLDDYSKGIATYEASLLRIIDITGLADSDAAKYLGIPENSTQNNENETKSTNKAATQEQINQRWYRYKDTVNMSYSELKSWSETDYSKQASLDREPISRNLHLLSTKKADWGLKEFYDAGKTIAFVNRMKNKEQDEIIEEYGLSKRDISLKNCAYDTKKQ